MASEQGTMDRIRWDICYIPNESIADYFVSADVVALPYVKIYQSAVLQLAYAFGKPVVASDLGGVREAVEEDGSGLLVPPCEPKALADALVKVLTNDELARVLGERGKLLARTKYSWRGIAAKTRQIYEEVLAQ